MMRFVVSTVGTSILTNPINRGDPNEATWSDMLRDSANLKQDELDWKTKDVIDILYDRALTRLLKDDVGINRRISAELNGIYGIYGGRLPQNSSDQHYLICTDTAQGRQTGELIVDFLERKGFTVNIVTPSKLSTKNTEVFATGTKELITWLDNAIPRPGSGWDVIFNLVGGFKSLQGYMQTFGTFYADEIVYIFEGSTDLIKIPRLPIQIDTTVIQQHPTKFALMAAGALYPIEKLSSIPETLLELVADEGETSAGLSAWGELIWNQTKSDLLAEDLLPFPRLEYKPDFIKEYKVSNKQQRIDLQETLARIAVVLEDNSGNTTLLNKEVSGLNFEKLTNLDIYTFRITDNYHVSCEVPKGKGALILRHYGTHDYVYGNP